VQVELDDFSFAMVKLAFKFCYALRVVFLTLIVNQEVENELLVQAFDIILNLPQVLQAETLDLLYE